MVSNCIELNIDKQCLIKLFNLKVSNYRYQKGNTNPNLLN